VLALCRRAGDDDDAARGKKRPGNQILNQQKAKVTGPQSAKVDQRRVCRLLDARLLKITHDTGTNAGSEKERVELAMDKLSVNFGLKILRIVPGYVSTEVDARLSYDTEATVAKGRSIVALYKAAGERRKIAPVQEN